PRAHAAGAQRGVGDGSHRRICRASRRPAGRRRRARRKDDIVTSRTSWAQVACLLALAATAAAQGATRDGRAGTLRDPRGITKKAATPRTDTTPDPALDPAAPAPQDPPTPVPLPAPHDPPTPP